MWTGWGAVTLCWSWTLAQAHDAPSKARGANASPTHFEFWGITLGLQRGCQQQANPHSHFSCCCCVWCWQPQCRELPHAYQGLVTAPASILQLGMVPWVSVTSAGDRTVGTTQTSLPRTHSGRNHSGIFITSWIRAGCGLPAPPLTYNTWADGFCLTAGKNVSCRAINPWFICVSAQLEKHGSRTALLFATQCSNPGRLWGSLEVHALCSCPLRAHGRLAQFSSYPQGCLPLGEWGTWHGRSCQSDRLLRGLTQSSSMEQAPVLLPWLFSCSPTGTFVQPVKIPNDS